MGYLTELDTISAPILARRPSRATRIVESTPLVPYAVAEAVWWEASQYLGEELPHEWVGELAAKAEVIATRNPRFNRRLREPGDRGREWLWAFTRHWLAALLAEHRPNLHARLPFRYATGEPPP